MEQNYGDNLKPQYNLDCSQNSGSLLVIDYITAPNT